jgi:multifunctional methyltransferase subunit TRM112
MLQCHARGCTTRNYPLRFEDVQLETEGETEMNPDFLVGMLSKLDWTALRTTAIQVSNQQHTIDKHFVN